MTNSDAVATAAERSRANVEPLREKLAESFRHPERLADEMAEIFAAMDLPLPSRQAIVTGYDGILMALDDYGIVFRLEKPKERINNHPLVLQPLKSHGMAGGIFEICPGVNIVEGNDLAARSYTGKLQECGLDFWDNQLANMGTLPQAGTTIIIDRLSVRQLGKTPGEIKRAWAKAGPDRQKGLYKALRASFQKAWPAGQALPDRDGFQAALRLCRLKMAEGVLVSGWRRAQGHVPMYEQAKRGMLADAGEAYARQTRLFDLSR